MRTQVPQTRWLGDNVGDSGSAGDDGGMTAAELRTTQFPPAKGFGRGYDTAAVDRTMSRHAILVERLSTELVSARDEVAELRARLERESADALIEHSVNVLTTAQETADKILARADHQRERTETERQEVLALAREAAALLQRDSQRRAKLVSEEATRRVAGLEQDIARLTVAAEIAELEMDREARHLRAMQESSRAQLVDAIDGVLEHLAEQYGRAHPLAAQAALARERSAAGNSPRQAVPTRGRRGLRVAGRPTDRPADPPQYLGGPSEES